MDENDVVYRLRKRAEIRRQIPSRKSVQEGKPDRIADLLEEAAIEIEHLRASMSATSIENKFMIDHSCLERGCMSYEANSGEVVSIVKRLP